MTVDCLPQLCVTAHLRRILLFSRFQVPLQFFRRSWLHILVYSVVPVAWPSSGTLLVSEIRSLWTKRIFNSRWMEFVLLNFIWGDWDILTLVVAYNAKCYYHHWPGPSMTSDHGQYKCLAQFSLNNVHKRGLKHHHFQYKCYSWWTHDLLGIMVLQS